MESILLFPAFQDSPGPGAYNDELVRGGVLSSESSAPKISMTSRNHYPWKNYAPPPTTYTLPTTIGKDSVGPRKAPMWSLKSRYDHGTSSYDEIRKRTPGAAAYNSTDPNVTGSKSGVYSLKGRTIQKNYNTVFNNPGPGTYTPQTPKKGGFSMGVKHSSYSVMCIPDIDCI